MNRLFLMLLLGCLSSALTFAQQAPTVLFRAAHCLATEKQDWLDIQEAKPTSLKLGYVVDTESAEWEKYLTIARFSSVDRKAGYVFEVAAEHRDGVEVFTIVNNARFVVTKKGIDFPEPPLGGVWKQEHLVKAISEIRKRPVFRLRSVDLLKAIPDVRCTSYADQK